MVQGVLCTVEQQQVTRVNVLASPGLCAITQLLKQLPGDALHGQVRLILVLIIHFSALIISSSGSDQTLAPRSLYVLHSVQYGTQL